MAPEPNANGMSAQTQPPQGMPSSMQDSEVWTTNTGAPVVNDQNSLTSGRRGPILLEDYHLIEKLAQFDRERIPERVVHARGFVAKGYFEATADISHLTFASPFAEVGKRTPVAVRLSTVIHERGSPESLRDVRGFSVKFYTETGNWDIVGNNIPVFFIRDGIQFPDMVHALKPNPRSHLQEGWRILDFLSHHPESCHILTWLLDDHGIPADWRHMEGFGVHTFKFVNAEGKETYVKLHFKPKDGVKFLSDEESKMVGTANKRHSHATEDAFEAIERGECPEWTFKIQTMEIADEFNYEFDPLDATKDWDEERFPMIEVGRMVLDQNVDNFFNDNEQIAFSPGVLIPGILASDDKLLQTRIFSYSDTQRHRLGPNYLMLPINAPRNKHHNNHYDGFMNFTHRNEEIDYFPSRNNNIKEAKINAPVWQAETVHGQRTKEMIEKENNFYQAGQRFRSFDPARQERFIGHLLEWMTEPKCTTEVKQVWLQYWAQVDEGLVQKLESGLKEAGAI